MKTRISTIIVLTVLVFTSFLSACDKQAGENSTYLHKGEGYGGSGGAGGQGGGGAGGSGGGR